MKRVGEEIPRPLRHWENEASLPERRKMKFHLTEKSDNTKTGPIPVSTSDPMTCPRSCRLFKACYAKQGHLHWFWIGMSRGKRNAIDWSELIQRIQALPEGTFWRHNQAGDLPGIGERISGTKFLQLVKANEGKAGFTFTHKKVLGNSLTARRNRKLIKEANKRGFRVNLSADSPREADKLARLKIAPVVTVVEKGFEGRSAKTPEGRPIVRCLATYIEGITCSKCKLCQKERQSIVAFPMHGTGSKRYSVSMS
jgi:hypothetical protein